LGSIRARGEALADAAAGLLLELRITGEGAQIPGGSGESYRFRVSIETVSLELAPRS
jgi:hypothetical protein